jgi:hypothetical protein
VGRGLPLCSVCSGISFNWVGAYRIAKKTFRKYMYFMLRYSMNIDQGFV